MNTFGSRGEKTARQVHLSLIEELCRISFPEAPLYSEFLSTNGHTKLTPLARSNDELIAPSREHSGVMTSLRTPDLQLAVSRR